jgi:SAM-dependent methyltransferase
MMTPTGYPLDGGLSIGVCHNCDFVFNLGSSVEQDYDRYYLTLNKHNKRSPNHLEIDVIYFKQLIEFININAQFNLIGKKILDFGSATNIMSEILLGNGAQSVVNFDYGQSETDMTEFDLIISTHTFEHILDVRKTFEQLLKLLKVGGLIVIAVPDLSSYFETYYGPFAQFDLEHINHFTENSLTLLFESCNVNKISTRKSERLVGPFLAYSEVLIIGRKELGEFKKDKISTLMQTSLDKLFLKYEKDMELMYESFENHISLAEKNNRVIFSFYGLSSYTFRFFNMIQDLGQFQKISFFGDSDSRLNEFNYLEQTILDKDEYLKIVTEFTKKGYTFYIFICVINYQGILKMLEEFADNGNVKVVRLEPETQNRLETIS